MIIHLVGTKAQYIKMAPVILETAQQRIPYRLVYTGQHSETFTDLQSNFGLGEPDLRLTSQGEATSRQSFAGWALAAWRAANSSAVRDIWREAGAIVVHGDTASTLLGARLARRYRRPLVHVEAGLRSFNYLHPFPEEVIRVLVSRIAVLHCCPDEIAVRNLERAGIGGEKLMTNGNTLIDSLRIARAAMGRKSGATAAYGIFSMHRHENLFDRQRLRRALLLLRSLAEIAPIRFVLHPVTRRRLVDMKLLAGLHDNQRIELVPRMDFFSFNGLLRDASFVVTDGGSNQEECALLNIPCVLIRRATERQDGLGDNVLLGDLDVDRILQFVRAAVAKEKVEARLPDLSPSKLIVERLAQYADQTDKRKSK